MTFLDTNLIISFVFETDTNHNLAVKTINTLPQRKIYITPITLLELKCVACRKLLADKLVDPLKLYIDNLPDIEAKCKTILTLILEYLGKSASVEILDDPNNYHPQEVKLHPKPITLPKIITKAMNLAPIIRLRTLDLLNITYIATLLHRAKTSKFITLDTGFLNYKDTISKELGITVEIPQH